MSNDTSGLKPPWPKGTSGNPGGRPKGYTAFRALCRERTFAALEALTEALENEGERVAAAKVLLEFGWGKAEPRSKMSATTKKLRENVPTADEAAAAARELRELTTN